MQEDQILERTNRVNTLFDFYGPLLTDKQQEVLTMYYQDNYSLGEIAAELDISRQAVYEHVKRSEQMLEDYEAKLKLADKYEKRMRLLEKLTRLLEECGLDDREDIRAALAGLKAAD